MEVGKNFQVQQISHDTRLRKLEHMIKEKKLRWLGHVLRMENSRIPHQAIQWKLRGYTRKPGRPKNWTDIIRQDLKDMDITWEEAKKLATGRAEWRQRVAQWD